MKTLTSALVIAAFIIAPQAFAHHSRAQFDQNVTVNVEGIVSDYVWANPHVYISLEARGTSGQMVEWEIEADPTPLMMRNGWEADTIAPGDQVSLLVNPGRGANTSHALLVSMTKSDRTTLARRANTPPPTVSALSVAGVWGPLIGQTDPRREFEAGLPTAKGAEAQHAFTLADHPESYCVAEPTPGSIDGGPYLHEIEIGEDVIYIRTEYFSIERIVYMDGRGHPENGERSLHGHSIGHWEDDVLVVDTALFADYRTGNLEGIPSGALKHVVERYYLSPDRTQLIVEYVGEDPEYLATPITGTLSRNYAPERELLPFECDLENAGRYLEG